MVDKTLQVIQTENTSKERIYMERQPRVSKAWWKKNLLK